jgi:hypothetical protein
MEIHGGCLCGGTRYTLLDPPDSLGDCHCVDCRRAAGAPYVTWGTIKAKALKLIRGDLRKIAHAGRLRSFAACCGTPLFFEDSPGAESIDVTIASFDDPAPFAPRKAIWTEDKLPWVHLDPELPAFPQSTPEKLS